MLPWTIRDPVIPFDLAALMRRHKVTIRQLAKRTNVTMKRIREIRAMDRVDYFTYQEWTKNVTGEWPVDLSS